ncbi:glycoside hydrolase family 3 protein [Xylona heveae TC161]|uniref:Probable beta-glucosidase G n=1 Tax=Xylona heveae (strain CBS 132557 / TC161) TaxID=1328760 RepID=A0A165FH70_XYLHT|nr:glycoside hydrolase family 3 protein [Xylona heveae TC161]KZF20977.1 glycoside hydrolase family 3 protein [Xylona heveae TC161]
MSSRVLLLLSAFLVPVLSTNSPIDHTRWLAAQSKADSWISSMNLTEKAGIVTGTLSGVCIEYVAPIERLGFSGLCLQDGPAGIRLADLASVFPAGVTTAATWDKELMYERGSAMAAEFKAKGAHVILGPSGGPLGRSAWGGRNWEGFSPDPYLTGIAMDHTIRGIQDMGVQASAKHLVGNEQETQRKPTTINGKTVEAISSNIDDRTLHELYLWPFADAVHAGVASVMCGYNRVNETYSCENKHLMVDILKGELGFPGYVMSDFFATHSGVRAIEAGLDMNQPGPLSLFQIGESYWGPNIPEAVLNGTLSMNRLDDMVRRILTPFFYLGQDEGYPTIDPASDALFFEGFDMLSLGTPTPVGRDVRGNHSVLIRQIAAAGSVLLKNENATLPLDPSHLTNIGVFGSDASDPTTGLIYPDDGFEIGTLIIGGGSGGGRPSYIVTPLDAVKSYAREIGARVQYNFNNTALAAGDFSGIYPWPDVCLVFLKTWETEGVDRISLEADDDSAQVVNSVASLCPGRTVVVTHSGGANTMSWATNPNVTAIVAAHYPGQESGNSIMDILSGKINPSGKLPYTIAANAADYNAPIVNITGPEAEGSSAWQSDFTEGLFIDYRHFDEQDINPLYEFGFGLSYTSFELGSSLAVAPSRKNLTGYPPRVNSTLSVGGNPHLWETVVECSVDVSNTGPMAGSTVVQLYVSLSEANIPPNTPMRTLRGFEKVHLETSETQTISFQLTRRDVSYWDVMAQDWKIPAGNINISVGFSSRDRRIEATTVLLQG